MIDLFKQTEEGVISLIHLVEFVKIPELAKYIHIIEKDIRDGKY